MVTQPGGFSALRLMSLLGGFRGSSLFEYHCQEGKLWERDGSDYLNHFLSAGGDHNLTHLLRGIVLSHCAS